MPKNTGHSEYFLLKNPDALDPMLTTYKNNDKHHACPEAFFLYTHLSPCHLCAKLIMKTVLRLHNICEEVNFYLGYTKIYEKEWVADEKKLKKMGVVVLHI